MTTHEDQAGEQLRSIQCTSCAAPLKLGGGHRVRTLTCSYCGAVMDAHADFRLLAQYRNLERPLSPFGIGMKGVVKEVAFTVIGTVAYRSQDAWGVYDWVSHQIFSPTHGYAWLTFNAGHIVFSRRVRDLPDPPTIGRFERKRSLGFRGLEFRQYEAYEARITFVEGELTWIARLDDRVQVIETISPPFALEFEMPGSELEYSLSEYLPRDAVEQGFGIDLSAWSPDDIHPAQPFVEGSFARACRKVGWYGAVIAACGLLMTFILGSGSTVLEQGFDNPAAGIPALVFDISRPDQLVRLELQSPVDNAWTFYEITVDDTGGEPVLALGSEISYYHGYDDGSWSEGSRYDSTLFRVPAAGRYTMEIEIDPESPQVLPLGVRITQGAMPLRYFLLLFVAAVLATAIPHLRRWSFERRRWNDGEDDDD